MQKAFVTGANGFVGTALVRRLCHDGVNVTALCRDPGKGEHLSALGAEVVRGDIQDLHSLSTMKGCDVVFHVAAVKGPSAPSYNVNVLGSVNVVEAARKAGVGRLVHVSSIAVYGYEVRGNVFEDHPQHPSSHDYYMQSKALGESAVWKYARAAGLPTVSIRPGFVYGQGSSFWSKMLYQLVKQGIAPLIKDGKGSAHPIFVEDVVDLLVTCATHPDAPDHAFNCTPDPAPTWAEFLGFYAHMTDRESPGIRIPMAAAPLAALITWITRLRGDPTDAMGMIKYIGRDVVYRTKLAQERLGWSPRYTLEEGMKLTEPWLRSLN
ncbi:UDP-glucose 4-epimerase [Anaerolineae bacterium]|nr:UDP-glucose 4-epimerase [Anaerolineae bacterium]